MSLTTYQAKRHFNRTPEPRGKTGGRTGRALRYVIQKHDASRLHYDFRLEYEGVLKSWAVPKGPSLDPGRKALAVQVEDHPVDYGNFEGVIPEGEYGGGTVLLWDTGTWKPLEDAGEGLKNGKLRFELDGKKLHGGWSLVRMHGDAGGGGRNWLLIKAKDEYASTSGDILADSPESVKTKRSMEQIAGQRDDVWNGEAKKVGKISGAEKSAWPGAFSPQLAVLAESPPAGEQWLHEIKFDGYRILARIKSGKVELITRGGNDWTNKFPEIAKAFARLKVDSAIVDGEVVVLDKEGRSDFQALQRLLKHEESAAPVCFVFDLPFCDGFDLRNTPLIERKSRLEKILERSRTAGRIRYSEHVKGHGDAVAEKACDMALEGIVSKRADAPYVSRRDTSWLKSKCGQRQEFVIIGYTDPQGSRAGFGSLLLGYHDSKNRLTYAGRVGTGFDQKLLRQTIRRFGELKLDKAPTDEPPPARERRDAHWVKPTLVAEVKFTGWTRDGMLRHPAFLAFRLDKPASEIVREKPVSPKKVEAMTKSKTKIVPAKAADAPPIGSGSEAIAGVTLTHPDRILYPDSKTTKRDVAEFYAQAAQWMLPHVIDRPLALLRCPGGMAGKCFFQRNWSDSLPGAVGKVDVGEGKSAELHVSVHDLSGVISLAQIGVLEIHGWNCRVKNVERPDQLVFDLDPGPGLKWGRLVEAAVELNRTLEELNLPTFLKTSGGKGVHITIPIKPNIEWDSAKLFCGTIARSLAQKSKLFVANMRKDLRGGKVYIDYNRNGRSATAVVPYSTRARDGAPVAMPIGWEELAKLKSAADFTVASAGKYLKKRKKDPWRDFESARVDLRKAIGRSAAA